MRELCVVCQPSEAAMVGLTATRIIEMWWVQQGRIRLDGHRLLPDDTCIGTGAYSATMEEHCPLIVGHFC